MYSMNQSNLLGDMRDDTGVDQSQMQESDRPFSPIPFAKFARVAQEQKEEALPIPELYDAVRLRVPMPNFSEVSRLTERRKSFECTTETH